MGPLLALFTAYLLRSDLYAARSSFGSIQVEQWNLEIIYIYGLVFTLKRSSRVF